MHVLLNYRDEKSDDYLGKYICISALLFKIFEKAEDVVTFGLVFFKVNFVFNFR